MRMNIETVEHFRTDDEATMSTNSMLTTMRESRSEPTLVPLVLGATAAALLALGGNAASASDASLWSADSPPTETATAIPAQQVGVQVSRAEALARTKAILLRAERERNEIAASEASRGIQWDD